MAEHKSILVVDDDPTLLGMTSEYLAHHAFNVLTAADGEEMKRALSDMPVDLIILDMKLGGENGLALLRQLRPACDVPVIVLTGAWREEADRVAGLEMGADDYLLKPFSPRELVARVRAVLRRTEARPVAVAVDDRNARFRFAGWELNARTHSLTRSGGEPVPLTHGEFSLLMAFLRSPMRVLTREQLVEATHLHAEVFDRSIDAQILRLRRKLEPDPSQPSLIRTERGAGYKFTATVTVH